MKRSRPIILSVLCALLGLLVFVVGSAASGARIRVGPLVLEADGGFTPRQLPRRTYAPIKVQGYADIHTTNSKPPPALRQIMLEFDRDGLLTTTGLASCAPEAIQGASPGEARQTCQAAIIGTGHVTATVSLPGHERFDVQSPLTLFNGPRQEGNPTVIAHAQATVPVRETYVVVIPIEQRSGIYRYRTIFDLPVIAGGYGALTHVDAKIGKRYRARGNDLSYASARCSDGILETRGRAWFADGTIISGGLYRACKPLE